MNAKTLKTLICGLTLIVLLSGCSTTGGGIFRSKNKVSFSNMTDSWLSVRFYVAENSDSPHEVVNYVGGEEMKVQPGETERYSLTQNPNYDRKSPSRIHVEVTMVTPSWQEAPTPYWMEMLSSPPFTIVATGDSDHIKFSSGDAALVAIPQKKIKRGNFNHTLATAQEESSP